MFYVDKVDAKIGNQPHRNKSITVAISKQLIHFATSNAHAYWQVQTNKKIEFREFLEGIVIQYLEERTKRKEISNDQKFSFKKKG